MQKAKTEVLPYMVFESSRNRKKKRKTGKKK